MHTVLSVCAERCHILYEGWLQNGTEKDKQTKDAKRANVDAENMILRLWQKLWLFEYVIIIVNSLRIINLLHQFPDRRVFLPEEIKIQIQTAMSVNTGGMYTTLAAFDIS